MTTEQHDKALKIINDINYFNKEIESLKNVKRTRMFDISLSFTIGLDKESCIWASSYKINKRLINAILAMLIRTYKKEVKKLKKDFSEL